MCLHTYVCTRTYNLFASLDASTCQVLYVLLTLPQLERLLFIIIRATREDFDRSKNRFLFEIAEALNCIPILVEVKVVKVVSGSRVTRQDSNK